MCKSTCAFSGPKLLFDFNVNLKMIGWQNTVVSILPVLLDNLKDVLKSFKKLAIPSQDIILELSYHMQAIEKVVKLVPEASACTMASEERDGYIKTKVRSPAKIPHFDLKHEYSFILS